MLASVLKFVLGLVKLYGSHPIYCSILVVGGAFLHVTLRKLWRAAVAKLDQFRHPSAPIA